jgi:hypothetical protein
MTLFELTINGRSYGQLSPEEKGAWLNCVKPHGSSEYEWFAGVWLKTNQAGVAAVNNILPSGTQVWGLNQGTDFYLSSDLLTDCEDGGTYGAAGSLLRAMPIVNWTPPADEEI